jgi:NAD(P)-dependent dehydrogenase (short-subunit alcohol dehydrogenase family)
MHPDTLVILTGASRGLGHGVAVQYLQGGAHVLGLSRRPAVDLEGVAAGGGGRVEQWAADLESPLPIAERLGAWLAAIGTPPARVRLIHNAALLSAPGTLGEADAAETARSLRVGLEAPLALTATFLRATGAWTGSNRRVLFVSSGLGRRPMVGSVAYCAQKAGLDHAARALALEEAARPNGARVAAVAPGVIDTDMQAQLRGTDFPERERFAELHRSGSLDSPAQAAAKLIALLERADYGANPVTDVRG